MLRVFVSRGFPRGFYAPLQHILLGVRNDTAKAYQRNNKADQYLAANAAGCRIRFLSRCGARSLRFRAGGCTRPKSNSDNTNSDPTYAFTSYASNSYRGRHKSGAVDASATSDGPNSRIDWRWASAAYTGSGIRGCGMHKYR